MAADRVTLRDVEWMEVFPALRLFSALRMALNFRALLLAAIAIAGTAAGWRICGQLFSQSNDPWLDAQIAVNDVWPWELPLPAIQGPVEELTTLETWRRSSPVIVAWNEITKPFVQIFEVQDFTRFGYLLCCALWSLLIWSFFGGAITRQAAVAFAREENVSWGRLAGFVRSRLGAYFVAPLFPVLGTLLAAIFLAVLGLVMRAEFGVLIGGILWPLALLAGFIMAFLLIGLFFGWPLMWGAISAEGTDSFGALSHSYSYAYQRPLHYLTYVVIAAIIGVLGWYLVSLFTVWIMMLTSWAVSWGSGTARVEAILSRENLGVLGNAGTALIAFWNNCLRTLAFGFIFSYLWCATTVIYFLLRRLVDATEFDEVYMPEERARHGLPPLKTGPDGVPTVDDGPAPLGGGASG
jgi:hypothetical protein